MPIFLVSIIVQVCFVIHVVKTGRNTIWIWIIIMLPLAGSIAYFILEIYPELSSSRTARRAKSSVGKTLNPNRDIKEAIHNQSMADTVENSVRLAYECLKKNMYSEAKGYFTKSLQGIHEHDPEIMLGLAKSEFGLNNFEEVKTVLDKLIKENPDYKDGDAHLLYARSLENLKETQAALEEYEALNKYQGPESSYRYALLLKKNNEITKAKDVLNEVIKTASHSGKHYNDLNKKWIKSIKAELKK